MPRTVDHETRRREIVEAAWRVVLRDGYAGLSVRTVATEGGWSPGSLRHFFGTQDELVAATATMLSADVAQRLASHATDGGAPGLEELAAVIEEVLPLDRVRRREVEVWLALVAAARTDPSLGPLVRSTHRDLRALMEGVVVAIAARAGTDLDVRLETDRLHALVDGMALHAALHPRDLPATRVRAALAAHLASLAH